MQSKFCFQKQPLRCAIFLSASLLSGPLWAQDKDSIAPPAIAKDSLEPTSDNGKQIYEAAQFARFAPQNALDMISQIPNFQISGVSGERGLGEASQNILINGQRITGKGNDATSVLSRTAISSVVRIEIADGAAFNITGINGRVANVITKTKGISGNYTWRPEYRPRLALNWKRAEINLTGKIGKADFTLGIDNNDSFRNGFWGPERATDSNGNLLYTRDRFVTFYGDRPRIAGTIARKSDAGTLFNANASAEFFRFRRTEDTLRLTPNAANIIETGGGSENEWNAEVGADYEFGAFGGRLKLIGYGRYEHSPNISRFRSDYSDGVTLPTGRRFNRVIDEGESVARAEYRWKSGKADWQLSAEGAYNFLDAKAALFVLDSNAVFQPQNLDGASSKVEEKRGQVLLSYARPLSLSLNLQTSFGGEYSQLSQSGGLSRTFFRPKGSAILAWKATPRLSTSLKVERKVGQLNFGDFLASVSVEDNINNGSNVKLRPPQSWLSELEVNRSLGAAGSLKLQIAAEAISDAVDQIALSATEEAPGNLDSTAKRLRGEITGAFVLDAIGFKGAKLDTSLAVQTTSVTDDLGIKRPISSRGRYGWSIDFRHDIPGSQWAWGLYAQNSRQTPFYRLDFVQSASTSAPFMLAFIEHKNILGLKARFNVFNILNRTERSKEIFYTGRRDGNIDFIQRGTERSGIFYRLTLSGTF